MAITEFLTMFKKTSLLKCSKQKVQVYKDKMRRDKLKIKKDEAGMNQRLKT